MQRPLDGASRSLFKMYSICLAGPRVGSNGLKKERDARWRYSRHPSLECLPRSALSFLRLLCAFFQAPVTQAECIKEMKHSRKLYTVRTNVNVRVN